MCKLYSCFLLFCLFCGYANAESILDYDTSDPLYMLHDEDLLSETGIIFASSDDSDAMLRVGEALSYGINDRLNIGARVHYQFDFGGDEYGRHENGFSSIDLGGAYRLGRAGDNSAHMISDALFGLKFGGSSHVRTPWFADSTYYAGLRFGRQWTGLSLSGTIKSSWIFDDERGMSYIDFIPEAYFRFVHDIHLGTGLTIRKSTNPHYNQEWINTKFVAGFGRTQYIGVFDYEFERSEFQLGFKLNILF